MDDALKKNFAVRGKREDNITFTLLWNIDMSMLVSAKVTDFWNQSWFKALFQSRRPKPVFQNTTKWGNTSRTPLISAVISKECKKSGTGNPVQKESSSCKDSLSTWPSSERSKFGIWFRNQLSSSSCVSERNYSIEASSTLRISNWSVSMIEFTSNEISEFNRMLKCSNKFFFYCHLSPSISVLLQSWSRCLSHLLDLLF